MRPKGTTISALCALAMSVFAEFHIWAAVVWLGVFLLWNLADEICKAMAKR